METSAFSFGPMGVESQMPIRVLAARNAKNEIGTRIALRFFAFFAALGRAAKIHLENLES